MIAPMDLRASGSSRLVLLDPEMPEGLVGEAISGYVRDVVFVGTATVQLGPDRKESSPFSTEPAPIMVVIPQGETRYVTWAGAYRLVSSVIERIPS